MVFKILDYDVRGKKIHVENSCVSDVIISIWWRAQRNLNLNAFISNNAHLWIITIMSEFINLCLDLMYSSLPSTFIKYAFDWQNIYRHGKKVKIKKKVWNTQVSCFIVFYLLQFFTLFSRNPWFYNTYKIKRKRLVFKWVVLFTRNLFSGKRIIGSYYTYNDDNPFYCNDKFYKL